MKRLDLQVVKRTVNGKGGARSSRREGLVPGVIYGEKQDSLAIAVNRQVIEKAIYSGGESENMLVNLSIEGEQGETLTLLQDAQHHPLTGVLNHVDFRRVSTDRPIRTTVPVRVIGTARGVREGGILEQPHREVEIECLPLEIPNSIDVDVSNLDIGHSLHVSDLVIDAKYTMITAGERALVMVAQPKLEAGPAAVAAVATAGETPAAAPASSN